MSVWPRLLAAPGMMLLSACGSNNEANVTNTQQTDQQNQQIKSAPAANIQVLGEITATINSEPRTWYVLNEDIGGEEYGHSMQSKSSFLKGPNIPTYFTLFGHTAPDQSIMDPGFVYGSLAINGTIDTTNQGTKIGNVHFGLSSESGKGNFITAQNGKSVVEITSLADENGFTHLTGYFSGTLSFQVFAQPDQELEATTSDITITDGRFDVRLPTRVVN